MVGVAEHASQAEFARRVRDEARRLQAARRDGHPGASTTSDEPAHVRGPRGHVEPEGARSRITCRRWRSLISSSPAAPPRSRNDPSTSWSSTPTRRAPRVPARSSRFPSRSRGGSWPSWLVTPTFAIPGCNVHYDRCELHHVIWWRHGVRTDLDNLLALCERHHHHKIHDSGWELSLGPNRQLTIRYPDGTVPSNGPPGRRAARVTLR